MTWLVFNQILYTKTGDRRDLAQWAVACQPIPIKIVRHKKSIKLKINVGGLFGKILGNLPTFGYFTY